MLTHQGPWFRAPPLRLCAYNGGILKIYYAFQLIIVWKKTSKTRGMKTSDGSQNEFLTKLKQSALWSWIWSLISNHGCKAPASSERFQYFEELFLPYLNHPRKLSLNANLEIRCRYRFNILTSCILGRRFLPRISWSTRTFVAPNFVAKFFPSK